MKKNNFGLIGKTLDHSISDVLHQEIMKEAGIKGSYGMFEVEPENLEKVIASIRVLNIAGLNVTIPYKQDIMRYLDEIDQKAIEIGAVNTITLKENKAIGTNTDYDGFKLCLDKAGISISKNGFTLLGAGGAAKAVIKVLQDEQASKITLISRNPDKTKLEYPDFEILPYDEIHEIKDKYCLINCTPVGTYPNIEECPIKKEDIKKYSNVVDLIYNPQKTKLLKLADEYGINNINGLYMLIGQAIKAQEIWASKQALDLDDKKPLIDNIYEDIILKFNL
ncbi:Shikimate dehydrogenase [Acetoanaerobium sticklandii]|uniref:Shikimate dehydrogenase (NADP(+)) n=1 Tax=Acetoanaerobium sticklandii (strain ATCC 12662 / DSM 519 / JCM 1433 / CCUG 9281 / NCIMB 10654 / HF) TaxID=499177 RepID=E3PV40_ACESD|nr:shikimate dehydrogenase [Acetoanaerobium sticklandii]CBH22493.1 Shikimate dehydrogenase [Acetoanaerobium sticklandii]